MDNFVYIVMQWLTILFAVGTVGGALFVGKVWRKNNGY